MILPFFKMTGAGNVSALVDERDLACPEILPHGNMAGICNRRSGVGNEE